MSDPFDDLDLDALRQRCNVKWRLFPPDVLPSFVAEMDFPLAAPIEAAIIESIGRGGCGYMHPGALADTFAAFAERRFGWAVDPTRVLSVPDVMAGVAEILRLVTAPGDAVVINPPVYPPFYSVVGHLERRVVEAPLACHGDRWQLDLDALERSFAAGARAYLLCNPHNPTGTILRRDELEAIVALAWRYGVTVVSDEIHAPLQLPGSAPHIPYITLGDEAAAHGVTITSASKAWNIAGLKCAVVVAGSAKMQRHLANVPVEVVYRTGHLGVVASIAAWEHGEAWLDAVLEHLVKMRERTLALVHARLPGARVASWDAGYLAWVDCRALPLGDDPTPVLLERGRVAVGRGLDFGAKGAGFIRLTTATSGQVLEETIERLARGFGVRT